MHVDPSLDHPLLRNLNEPQRQAVRHAQGPLLILAGAGSGKTTVITRRIAWLIEEAGVRPSSILAVTFTNKAAEEMRERVQKLVTVDANQMWVSTFHSFCTRILRREGDRTPVGRDFVIFDPADQKSLAKQVLAELKLSEKQMHPRRLLEVISDWKNRCLLPEEVREEALDPWTRKAVDAYDLYQRSLKAHKACDFDDLLLHTERLFRDPVMQSLYAERFKFLLVDEYQDTNRAQYLLIQHLARHHHNLCVVGDEDQCLAAGTSITKADGTEVPIETIRIGDQVRAAHGSGDFRAATVGKVAHRPGGPGVRITTAAGRVLESTPEHMHFAGYRLGESPQKAFVYLMAKRGVGYRLGTSQTHTRGQVKPVVGFLQRARQEHADALWVLSVHETEAEARLQEELLSLQYQIPTLPFVPRKGRSQNGLVHDEKALATVFASVDTTAHAERLLLDLGMAWEFPHHQSQGAEGKRRKIVVTLCGDHRGQRPMHRLTMAGTDPDVRRTLEGLGFSVRTARAGSDAWRIETCRKDFGEVLKLAKQLEQRVDGNLHLQARLLDTPGREGASLPFLPACNVKVGMVLVDGEGRPDVVTSVERVGLGAVVDLDVEGVHNFVASGLVTHNSIYGWRGADIRNILDFQRDFPEAVQIKLEQNYRSTQQILDAATGVIANNTQRLGKSLWTDLGSGEKLQFRLLDDGRQEGEWVAERILEHRRMNPKARISILYRANWQSRQLEEALRAVNLPYKLVGGVKFYERMEVKDLLSYLRLVSNPFDLVSFRRAINSPSRGVGPTTLAKIEAAIPPEGTPLEGLKAALRAGEVKGRAQRELVRFLEFFDRAQREAGVLGLSALVRWVFVESGYAASLEEEGTLEAEGRMRNLEEFVSAAADLESQGLRLSEFLDRITLAADADQVEETANLSLMTIHCAKGLEFPVVFLVGMEEDVFPNRNSRDTEDGLEEERRLFYVAITRAQEKLYLTAARRRRVFGQENIALPSRFLKEVPGEVLENPIRWGTELFQSGAGAFGARTAPRGGGGASVAGELSRIRGMFDMARATRDLDPESPFPPDDHEPFGEDAPSSTPPLVLPSMRERPGRFNRPTERNPRPVAPSPSPFQAPKPLMDLPDEPEPEPPAEVPPGDAWPKGTRVRSPRFGRGVITGVSGRGDMLTYTIRFPEGEKRIVARFGALERE